MNNKNMSNMDMNNFNNTKEQFYLNKDKHFENISCKISLLSSYLTLFCLIWVFYLFITMQI